MIVVVASGAFLLDLTLLRLDLLVAALGQLVSIMIVVVGVEVPAGRGFVVDDVEGGIVVGVDASTEGIVVGEVEGGVG